MGFGTLRLPMNGDVPDYEEIQMMVDEALINGINYFDLGYSYGKEKAENAIGAALQNYPRGQYFLADKLPTWRCKEPLDVKKFFNEQLKRCGANYFDFYLIHSIKEKRYHEIEQYHVITQLKEELENGRIRHLGASVHCSPMLLETLLETYGTDLEFIQMQLNYLDWEFTNAKELHRIAVSFDMPIMIMEGLRGGTLAKPASASARKILDAIRGSRSYASLGYRFCDSLENVIVTLSGVSRVDELRENIETFNEACMTEEERNVLLSAAEAMRRENFIPCTKCDYCSECPQQIKISSLFSTYNEAAASGFNRPWMPLSKDYLAFEKNVKDCISCRLCESHCPQNIDITKQLRMIDEKYKQLQEKGM